MKQPQRTFKTLTPEEHKKASAANTPKVPVKRMLKREDFRQTDAEIQAERIRKDNQEYNDRLARLATAKKAENKNVIGDKDWRQNLADKTGAIGDKLRFSNRPNFFDDNINPASWVGDMASKIGQAPKEAKESNSVMPYVTSIGTPIATGALAGIGAKAGASTLKGLARQSNELFNPLAGVGIGKTVDKLGNKYLPNAYKLNPKAFKPNSDLAKSDSGIDIWKLMEEEIRVSKLPQTMNKQSLDVLDNFKQRIKTPEGKTRLKDLGISNDKSLQDLKIIEDPNTYGHYSPLKNKISMHPNHPIPRKVVRHEIEHAVQKAKIDKANADIGIFTGLFNPEKGNPAIIEARKSTTKIDDMLSDLKLRREATPNKVWDTSNKYKPVDISTYKSAISDRQRATDYFLTGSDGKEKSAFLGEVQQYMMDTGRIPKDSYSHITPEMVQETMADAVFDEEKGGKYLRLFRISKADPENYELISKALNKMLTVVPAAVAGKLAKDKYENKKPNQ
jgi:hypothetical protein